MKTSSLLVVSGLVLFSTLLMKASTAEVTPLASIGHTSAGSSSRADHCGGEPCDAVARGFRAFFDRKLDGLQGKWTRLRRLPHADGQFPALAGQRRGEVSVPPVAAAVESGRRRSAVPADRRG